MLHPGSPNGLMLSRPPTTYTNQYNIITMRTLHARTHAHTRTDITLLLGYIFYVISLIYRIITYKIWANKRGTHAHTRITCAHIRAHAHTLHKSLASPPVLCCVYYILCVCYVRTQYGASSDLRMIRHCIILYYHVWYILSVGSVWVSYNVEARDAHNMRA